MKELCYIDDGSTERAFIRKMRRSAIRSGLKLQFVSVNLKEFNQLRIQNSY